MYTHDFQPLPPLIAKPPSSAMPFSTASPPMVTKYDIACSAVGRNATARALVGLKSTSWWPYAYSSPAASAAAPTKSPPAAVHLRDRLDRAGPLGLHGEHVGLRHLAPPTDRAAARREEPPRRRVRRGASSTARHGGGTDASLSFVSRSARSGRPQARASKILEAQADVSSEKLPRTARVLVSCARAKIAAIAALWHCASRGAPSAPRGAVHRRPLPSAARSRGRALFSDAPGGCTNDPAAAFAAKIKAVAEQMQAAAAADTPNDPAALAAAQFRAETAAAKAVAASAGAPPRASAPAPASAATGELDLGGTFHHVTLHTKNIEVRAPVFFVPLRPGAVSRARARARARPSLSAERRQVLLAARAADHAQVPRAARRDGRPRAVARGVARGRGHAARARRGAAGARAARARDRPLAVQQLLADARAQPLRARRDAGRRGERRGRAGGAGRPHVAAGPQGVALPAQRAERREFKKSIRLLLKPESSR